MVGVCGNEKDSDALVTVNLDNVGIEIEIGSKNKKNVWESYGKSCKRSTG